jgi:hypothetical protein
MFRQGTTFGVCASYLAFAGKARCGGGGRLFSRTCELSDGIGTESPEARRDPVRVADARESLPDMAQRMILSDHGRGATLSASP